MKDEFLQLLQNLEEELNSPEFVYTEDSESLWCPEFADFVDCGEGSTISRTEKKLLTTYRKQFIAWLRITKQKE
jgi:hypothetical protein